MNINRWIDRCKDRYIHIKILRYRQIGRWMDRYLDIKTARKMIDR